MNDEEKNSVANGLSPRLPAQQQGLVISETTAAEVWRILRKEAGASSSAIERDCFILYARGRDGVPEFRFQGALGFGGKVYFREGRWGVYYYPEDKNAAREAIVTRTNAALAKLNTQDGNTPA